MLAETEILENDSSDQVELMNKALPAKQGVLKKPIVFGCLALVGLCLCGLFSVFALFFISFTPAEGEQDRWLALSNDYMQAMVAKDIDAAYGLFAREARREFSKRDMRTIVEGPLFAAIDGYSSLEIEVWEINYDFQLGRSVNLAGPISYQDDYEGYFDAVLIEEGDKWKLLWFNATAPAEKFNDYAGKNTAKSDLFPQSRSEKGRPPKKSVRGELAQIENKQTSTVSIR
jgi:hypothetical protein